MTRKISVSLPDAALRPYLAPHPDVTVLEWDLEAEAPQARIDIVARRTWAGTVLRRLEDVETVLVQSQSIGYDGVTEFLPAGRVFANAAGVHETSTAELALAMILASQRRVAPPLPQPAGGPLGSQADREPGGLPRPDGGIRRRGQGG